MRDRQQKAKAKAKESERVKEEVEIQRAATKDWLTDISVRLSIQQRECQRTLNSRYKSKYLYQLSKL